MKTAAVLFGLSASTFAVACCAVGTRGAAVRFTGQRNIVIWDAKRGVEHFIRDAAFQTKGKDLGFIAPTPSQPTLSDVDRRAFATLDALQPIPEDRNRVTKSTRGGPGGAGGVTVVSEQEVAGYQASVLKADDSASLSRWLKDNDYPAPRFLKGWVQPYIDKGWYLTAFKVKGGQKSSTGPVRMTFRTNQPFNPYSVPRENGGGGASLRIYYISAGNETPRIGGVQRWPGPTWTSPVPAGTSNRLADQLKLSPSEIPSNSTVRVYDDRDFGRPGLDDLYFLPQRSWSSNAAVGAASVVGAFVFLRRRRRHG